jgi:hypothetical protein
LHYQLNELKDKKAYVESIKDGPEKLGIIQLANKLSEKADVIAAEVKGIFLTNGNLRQFSQITIK